MAPSGLLDLVLGTTQRPVLRPSDLGIGGLCGPDYHERGVEADGGEDAQDMANDALIEGGRRTGQGVIPAIEGVRPITLVMGQALYRMPLRRPVLVNRVHPSSAPRARQETLKESRSVSYRGPDGRSPRREVGLDRVPLLMAEVGIMMGFNPYGSFRSHRVAAASHPGVAAITAKGVDARVVLACQQVVYAVSGNRLPADFPSAASREQEPAARNAFTTFPTDRSS
jgi:hypothetical protein